MEKLLLPVTESKEEIQPQDLVLLLIGSNWNTPMWKHKMFPLIEEERDLS